MLDKIKALISKVKPAASKVASVAPMPIGVAVGYMGHSVIKLAIDAIVAVVKGILG